MGYVFGKELEVKKLANGTNAVFGRSLTKEAALDLHSHYRGTLQKIEHNGTQVNAFVTKMGFDYEIRKYITQHQAFCLDWHDEAAVEQFGSDVLHYRLPVYDRLRRQIAIAKAAERGENKINPTAAKLIEHLEQETTQADLEDWLEKEW